MEIEDSLKGTFADNGFFPHVKSLFSGRGKHHFSPGVVGIPVLI